jgi:hypothetical protein
MTRSKSKQPEDQAKTHEQAESSAEPKVKKEVCSRSVPKGFVLDNSPSTQLFIGGLPGRPPDRPSQPQKEGSTSATEARFWPVPEGFRIADDEDQCDMIFIGGLPERPPSGLALKDEDASNTDKPKRSTT